MFFQIISSESLNCLLPNLVWWCIIMRQIVSQKDWFAVSKVKVVKDSTNSYIVVLLFLRSKSQCRFKMLLTLYVSYVFCTTGLLATKLGVLIYKCKTRKWAYTDTCILTYSITWYRTGGREGGIDAQGNKLCLLMLSIPLKINLPLH